jgi:flagellar hook-length control protein FliK
MPLPALQLNLLQSALLQALGLKATAKGGAENAFLSLLEKFVAGGAENEEKEAIIQAAEALGVVFPPKLLKTPAPPDAESNQTTEAVVAAFLQVQPEPHVAVKNEDLSKVVKDVGKPTPGRAAVFADSGKSLPQRETVAAASIGKHHEVEAAKEVVTSETPLPPIAVHGREALEGGLAERPLAAIPVNFPRTDTGINGPAQTIPASSAQPFIPVRVDSGAWADALGDRMVMMASRLEQVAELKLNPPNLGSIEVRLHLSGGEASAQFFAPQAAVREALETAMPRLREMFNDIGVQLGDVAVDARSAQGQEHEPGSGQQAAGRAGASVANIAEIGTRTVATRWNGWVDTFA